MGEKEMVSLENRKSGDKLKERMRDLVKIEWVMKTGNMRMSNRK